MPEISRVVFQNREFAVQKLYSYFGQFRGINAKDREANILLQDNYPILIFSDKSHIFLVQPKGPMKNVCELLGIETRVQKLSYELHETTLILSV